MAMNPLTGKEDDELLTNIAMPPQEVKPNFMDQLYTSRGFTPEKEEGLRADIAKAAPGSVVTFLASLGAGLAGQNQAQAVQNLRRGQDSAKERLNEYLRSKSNVVSEANAERQLLKSDEDQKRISEENDPNSEASERARQAAASALNVTPEKFAGMSAAKLKETSPLFAKVIEAERDRAQQMSMFDKKAASEREKAASSERFKQGAPKPTAGQLVVDKEFAKEYNEWTSGGEKIAKNEIDKLKGVVSKLTDGKVTTGGLTGIFPDRMTSNDVLSARADVSSTIMKSLKALLGAQFTEKEGERVIKATWNEADSTQNNIDRLQRLVTDLESQAIAKDAKSKYYEEMGTLQDFRMQNVPSANKPKAVKSKLFSPSRNQTKIIYEDGSEEVVDGKR